MPILCDIAALYGENGIQCGDLSNDKWKLVWNLCKSKFTTCFLFIHLLFIMDPDVLYKTLSVSCMQKYYFAFSLGIVMVLVLKNSIKKCFSCLPVEASCSTLPINHIIPKLLICTVLNLHISLLFLCTLYLFSICLSCLMGSRLWNLLKQAPV